MTTTISASVNLRVRGSGSERIAEHVSQRLGVALAEALGAAVRTAGSEIDEVAPPISVESSKTTVVEN